MRGDAGARPEAEAALHVSPRIEERQRSLEVAQAGRDLSEEGEARAVNELPVHLEGRVLLRLGQLDQLAAELGRPVELAAVEVEGGEAADDGSSLRRIAGLAGERERPLVVLLDLLGVAADRQQAPCEAGAQRDLLARTLRARGDGREHRKEVVRELDRRVVPAATVVKTPTSAPATPTSRDRSPCFDPVAPGRSRRLSISTASRSACLVSVGRHWRRLRRLSIASWTK